MVVGGAAGENRFFHAAKKTFTQGLVAVQRREQIGAVVVAGVMPVEAGAIVYHGAFQVFVEQAQARNQPMDRAQHRPGDIVGIHLVAAHHQQGRALGWVLRIGQQAINAKQAFVGTVVRFAARAVNQLMDTAVQHEVRVLGVGVQQVGCPLGYAGAVDEQVIVDDHILRQRLLQPYINQMDKRLAAHLHDLALVLAQRDIQVLLGRLQPQGQG